MVSKVLLGRKMYSQGERLKERLKLIQYKQIKVMCRRWLFILFIRWSSLVIHSFYRCFSMCRLCGLLFNSRWNYIHGKQWTLVGVLRFYSESFLFGGETMYITSYLILLLSVKLTNRHVLRKYYLDFYIVEHILSVLFPAQTVQKLSSARKNLVHFVFI